MKTVTQQIARLIRNNSGKAHVLIQKIRQDVKVVNIGELNEEDILLLARLDEALTILQEASEYATKKERQRAGRI